jgi:hypothetical protein
MLVFFIHGVATRDAQYAEQLRVFIRQDFNERRLPLPHFHASFWGNILRDIERMWNGIEQDLQELQRESPQANLDDIFRYRKFREGFLSQFAGDFLAYLNPRRGVAIRKIIAEDLFNFLKDNPEETEIHIIAHSLGSVILWDVLFSERFSDQDPAFDIRAMIDGLSQSSAMRKVCLKSITTMGSPILFLNTMLDVRPEKIKEFAQRYHDELLRWINIIHSSDIVASPIRASLKLDSSKNLFFRDEYISTDANLAEKAARAVGQLDAAMALGISDAHGSYLHCPITASLIATNILGGNETLMQKVINRLYKVPGMTKKSTPFFQNSPFDKTLEHLKFKDDSGTLRFVVNPLQVHHVYVFNSNDIYQFGGFVGIIDANALKKEVELIKRIFC